MQFWNLERIIFLLSSRRESSFTITWPAGKVIAELCSNLFCPWKLWALSLCGTPFLLAVMLWAAQRLSSDIACRLHVGSTFPWQVTVLYTNTAHIVRKYRSPSLPPFFFLLQIDPGTSSRRIRMKVKLSDFMKICHDYDPRDYLILK